MKQNSGKTALCVAIEASAPADRAAAVSLLLGAGASPNLRLPRTGDTALHLAVAEEDAAVLRALLAHPDIRLDERNRDQISGPLSSFLMEFIY